MRTEYGDLCSIRCVISSEIPKLAAFGPNDPRGSLKALVCLRFSDSGSMLLQFGFLKTLSVLGYDEVVDAVLDVSVHECCKVVDGVVDAVVRDAPLGIVVGTYLCRTVACRHQSLAS